MVDRPWTIDKLENLPKLKANVIKVFTENKSDLLIIINKKRGLNFSPLFLLIVVFKLFFLVITFMALSTIPPAVKPHGIMVKGH
jgi:hypothetical protein